MPNCFVCRVHIASGQDAIVVPMFKDECPEHILNGVWLRGPYNQGEIVVIHFDLEDERWKQVG